MENDFLQEVRYSQERSSILVKENFSLEISSWNTIGQNEPGKREPSEPFPDFSITVDLQNIKTDTFFVRKI